ncbi:MAG TPA: VOC family protein [Elainellaceae cyanobacterium]
MTEHVNPIPEGFHTATPMLAIRDAARAIEFYKTALGATEIMRLADPTGAIAHAEIQIGDSIIMMAEENPEFNTSPQTLGGSPVILNLYVEDVDALVQQAVDAGARVVFPVKDQFYGDRSGRIVDPFGHIWIISTHIEDVSPDEMQTRFDAMFSSV